jgi:chorismate mutase
MRNDDLTELRKQIDALDEQIAGLLIKRFAVVEKIGGYKKTRGLDVFHQDREAEVFKKIFEKTDTINNSNNNNQYAKYITRVYAGILEASKALQSDL